MLLVARLVEISQEAGRSMESLVVLKWLKNTVFGLCFITGLSAHLVVVGYWWPSLMEPHLFPECVICQVRAFGCTLRRPSLFCVCLAIPATAAWPRPLVHINIQLSHRMQRDRLTCTSFRGKPCNPSPPSQIQLTGSSRSRWAMEMKPLGTRQQLWAACCEL